MLDVMLVNPAAYPGSPRRGPYELSEFELSLIEAGLKVQLFDIQKAVGEREIPYPKGHIDAVMRLICATPAKIYFITVRTSGGPWVWALAGELKKCQANATIIAYAPRIEERMLAFMKVEHMIDALYTGSSSRVLVNAIKAAIWSSPTALVGLPGLLTKSDLPQTSTDAILDNTLGQDFRVGPAWTSQDSTIAAIHVGRGCPDRCTFCAAHLGIGKQPRYAVASEVVARAQEAFDQLPKDKRLFVMLETENITSNPDLLKEICKERKARHFDFHWGGYGRIDHMNAEMIALLANSGCRFVFLGLESASLTLLKTLGKRYDPTIVRPRIKAMHEAGITTQSSFIYGIPGETEQQFYQTADLMADVVWEGGYVDWTPLRIEAGTAMARMTINQSTRILRNSDIYKEIAADNWIPEDVPSSIGYRMYGLEGGEIDIDTATRIAGNYRSALMKYPMVLYAMNQGLKIPLRSLLDCVAQSPRSSGPLVKTNLLSLAKGKCSDAADFCRELSNFEELHNDPDTIMSAERAKFNFPQLYTSMRRQPHIIPHIFQLTWWSNNEGECHA